MSISFAWPWLFGMLPLPWLLRRFVAPAQIGAALRVSHLPGGATSNWSRLQPRMTLRSLVAILAWLLLVAAAARPQLPGGEAVQPPGARGMMLAFDVSRSMATADLHLDGNSIRRIDAARSLADAFLARLNSNRGDRVGLVVFGAQAYLHTPLTYDSHAVRAALGSVEDGLAGQETALGDAIALAVKYLMRLPQEQRVLVLLTDGASTAGTLAPARAAWLAERNGVTIHAAGIGAPSALDEEALRSITAQTGGTYARAADGAALAAFFDSLDRIAPYIPKEIELPPRELYVWPLALACMLAMALAWRQKVRAA